MKDWLHETVTKLAIKTNSYFEIENDLHKKMCQTPVYAPTAHKLQKKNEFLDESLGNSSYLFENIDSSLLKADEEFIRKTYK